MRIPDCSLHGRRRGLDLFAISINVSEELERLTRYLCLWNQLGIPVGLLPLRRILPELTAVDRRTTGRFRRRAGRNWALFPGTCHNQYKMNPRNKVPEHSAVIDLFYLP